MLASRRTVSSLERLLYLKKAPAFSSLPASELSVIAEVAQERFFPAGSALLREGESIGAVYFVVEGSIVLRRRGALVGKVGAGAALGGLALFARDPEGVEAVAEADTLTLELEADALLEVFEDRFAILLHIMRDLCRQLIDAHVRTGVDPTSTLPLGGPVPLPTRELDLVERIFFLRRMPVFRESSVNVLFELSRALTEVRFAPGITLWEAGDPALGIFAIVSGEVAGRIGGNGLDFRAGPGVPLGALESVAEVPRWYDAVTTTEVVALSANAEALLDVFEDNHEMAMDYMAIVARARLRLQEMRMQKESSALPEL